jgi:ubiquinol-cytochrome c reductase iron-sulfur subunit
MSTQTELRHDDEPEIDVNDPRLSRFDLVKEGARRDGVEIVHYEPRFPVPGTVAEKRIERTIALFFLLSGAAAVAFVIIYIAWPWKYESGTNASKLYNPLLGLTLALTLLGLGVGIITWAKKLFPHEVAIEHRHIGGSPPDEKKLTGALLTSIVDETGIQRRPLLKGALLAGLAPVGVVAAAPIVGALIKDPHHPDALMHTGFDPSLNGGQPVRLVQQDGVTPIRPADVSVGGQITVFPGIPDGTTNQYADSPTLLIHLRTTDADLLRSRLPEVKLNAENGGSMWGDYVAYSKICTHLGCPASLYEQQTNRLLCPCHQSQFLITDNARPIFGPATRRLPMLPITVDGDGYFVAKSDYTVAIGPAFWERP